MSSTTTTKTTSPTDVAFWANHTTEALTELVERLTNDSLYMQQNGGEAMATEAMKMANAAWMELRSRG